MRPLRLSLIAALLTLSLCAAEPRNMTAPATPAPASAVPLAPSAPAAVQTAPVEEDVVYIEGRVKVTANEKSDITAITLVATTFDSRDNEIKVPYRVVQDENGLRLARELGQKFADVACTVSNRGSTEEPELWITVKGYEAIPESGH